MRLMKKFLEETLPERMLMHLRALDHYMSGEPEIRLMRRLCHPDKVALDIGANIGTYTYFLCRYAGEVYAYEPNPEQAEHLTRLYPQVHVRNVAVSDSKGELTLRLPVENGRGQHELASVTVRFETDEVIEHTVDAITIDSEHLQNVGFIKVDVEQHELHALKGALDTIKISRPIIMTECTPLLYENDLPTTFRFITDLKYEGWFTFEGRHYPFSELMPEIHTNPEQFGTSFINPNIFFFPSEQSGKEYLT